MEVLIWVFIYIIFALISGIFTSKRPRKSPPTPRRETPVIIRLPSDLKPIQEKDIKKSKIVTEIEEQDSYTQVLPSAETEKERGGLDVLPLNTDKVISGIIYSQILSSPVGVKFLTKRKR